MENKLSWYIRTRANASATDRHHHSPAPERLARGPQPIPKPLKPEGWDKVFGIGQQKTGTTSLAKVFQHYGLLVPKQTEQETLLTDRVLSGDYSKLRPFVERYDAFQDAPFSNGLCFVACDVLFPDARFILTVRDEDDWFRSLYNFHKKVFGFNDQRELNEEFFKGKNLYLYEDYVYSGMRRNIMVVRNDQTVPDWDLLYDRDHYVQRYRARNEEIILYFQDRPEKLLVVDLTKEQDTAKIGNFLGFPESTAMETPHENQT